MVNGQEFSFTSSAERSIFGCSLYRPSHPFTAERSDGKLSHSKGIELPDTTGLSACVLLISLRGEVLK